MVSDLLVNIAGGIITAFLLFLLGYLSRKFKFVFLRRILFAMCIPFVVMFFSCSFILNALEWLANPLDFEATLNVGLFIWAISMFVYTLLITIPQLESKWAKQDAEGLEKQVDTYSRLLGIGKYSSRNEPSKDS